MEAFERTRLWRNCLAVQAGDEDGDVRERLRQAYLQMRANTAVVANEIARSMPDFTVHDITHSDALWELADAITGPDFHLSPTEAFTLGGAFLLHDLGMGLVAFPGGLDDLRASAEWRDFLASTLRRYSDEPPTESELDSPPDFVVQEATVSYLRMKHAERAEYLALNGWTGRSGEKLHLLSDGELRVRLGRLMGQLAHSHWWDVDVLPEQFGTRPTSLPGTPTEWTVDQLKLACLLRLADAAQLDSRRAPSFLYAVRRPTGESDLHWGFQERLERPHALKDRLVYTSLRPFERDFSEHWWLAFDSLRAVDFEFRKVDALLYDLDRPRFAVSGIAGVETPERFRRHVKTEGWLPVNAELRVGDVPSLVAELGGQALYGQDADVGVRELVQNAADAIQARRRLDPGWSGGRVLVRLRRDGEAWYLEVIDNGVGMSADVLTKTLLDFRAIVVGE